ncbi:MAG: MarR family transcriptional regulator [Solirubrobacteraceae bacterium]|jgi:DNA-binding IclR family transcriptional regulator
MNAYEQWLAAMPVDEVRARIAELERELDALRALEYQQQQAHNLRLYRAAVAERVQQGKRRRRLSPERMAIIDLIKKNPDGVSPDDVARAIGMTHNAAQTNLSRMQQAGVVQRVAQGLYKLPPHVPAAAVLNGATAYDPPDRIEALTPPQP